MYLVCVFYLFNYALSAAKVSLALNDGNYNDNL
jgi:hypothetical protein